MRKVSVLMPVYNAAPHLREAIDSILDQTYVDFEFIIINDGSSDASEAIILSYNDPRISYTSNQQNQGLVKTLNMGINLATGRYIARMDADDISLPRRFEKQIDFMDSHPDVGACGTAYKYFGEAEQEVMLPQEPEKCFALLASTSCLGHPTSMIRRSILDQYSLRYENEYENAEDYALWIRISQVSQLCSLPEVMLLYRWHSGNKSKTDENIRLVRGKARILWYELLLGSALEASQANYLKENLNDWHVFESGKKLILAVLERQHTDPALDKNYYGALSVTEWEQKSIRHFGLRALLNCLTQPAFRKWSRATTIGLLALYLANFGISIKR